MKQNKDSQVKTVFHLDTTVEDLQADLEAGGYSKDLMAEHLLYGFKVYAVNTQGSKGKDKRNPDLTHEFLKTLEIGVEREDDVPVARTDEVTQEAKAIAKAMRAGDLDPGKLAEAKALLGI